MTFSLARVRGFVLLACATGVALISHAQTARTPTQRTEEAFQAAKSNTGALRAFLVDMPKGADLHIHLGGAVYAESYIHEAAEDGLCFDIVTQSLEVPEARSGKCTPGTEASALPHKQALYDGLIDSLSMRDFIPTTQQSGHDHFFAAFDKVKAVSKRHRGEWLAEVTDRAAAQNEQYVEVMETLDEGGGAQLGARQGMQIPDKATDADFASERDLLLKAHLREGVADASRMLDHAETQRRFVQHCDEPARAKPGCAVTVRYLFQVLRGIPREAVFAQTLLAFEVASADPRVVGLNYVMPEDGYASMHDYALQMQWLGWFRTLYPQVHLSLHAGELAPGLVPPDGLRNHVRLAVEQAHADRIGHGVDVLWEENADQLLREMAAKHVMVEINLTSNDIILNVKGKDHPLPVYLAHHVPVALSTDDEGVSRIDITHEYLRAAQDFGLTYADLKQRARTSIAHTFLPGLDLWAQPDVFSKPAAACSGDSLGAALSGTDKPSAKCAAFLASSQHAQQEWQLEQRFRAFEARH
jgi:adenosine deaminase